MKWQPFFEFFIIANTDMYDDVPKLKTFMHGHLHVMTFLHLKVYDG